MKLDDNNIKRDNDFKKERDIEYLSKIYNINPKIMGILYSRGLTNQTELNKFFYPDIRNLYNPFLMKGMNKAVKRINEAIEKKQKIVVYGDYDADGITAAAVLYRYFKELDNDVYVHIPSRLDEGYGLNCTSLEELLDNQKPELIITCDCGISGFNEVEYVREQGVDIIITDHHECSTNIPKCIVINPKQPDCCYPFKYLSGAGVVFKLIQSLSNLDTALNYVDLVALANIADLVPLVDENRLIVQLGIEKLAGKSNRGLKLLCESQNLIGKISCNDISHKIVPRINAAGRMGDAYRALTVLTSDDDQIIKTNISELNEDNEHRKKCCEKLYFETLKELENFDLTQNKVIIITAKDWAKGLTGIVAAKLSNEFNRPTIILIKSDKKYKGTARSIEGINIYSVLNSLKEILCDFGGHAQAAGFSILEDKLSEFKERVNGFFCQLSDDLFLPNYSYDAEITLHEINYKFVKELQLIEPTGNLNPLPLFLFRTHHLNVITMRNTAHSCIYIKPYFQIMYFNAKNNEIFNGNTVKNLILELSINNFNKNDAIKGNLRQLYIEDIFLDERKNRTAFIALHANRLQASTPIYKEFDRDEIGDIIGENKWGTMVVTFDKKNYLRFNKIKPSNIILTDFLFSSSKNNYSKIFISPIYLFENPFSFYKKIIFLERPLDLSCLSYINSKTNAEIFIPKDNNYKNLHNYIDTDREVMINYYNLIKKECIGIVKKNYLELFSEISKNNKYVTLEQFVFALLVFREIGLIDIEENNGMVLHLKQYKSALTNSALYNMFCEHCNKNEDRNIDVRNTREQ